MCAAPFKTSHMPMGSHCLSLTFECVECYMAIVWGFCYSKNKTKLFHSSHSATFVWALTLLLMLSGIVHMIGMCAEYTIAILLTRAERNYVVLSYTGDTYVTIELMLRNEYLSLLSLSRTRTCMHVTYLHIPHKCTAQSPILPVTTCSIYAIDCNHSICPVLCVCVRASNNNE